MEDFKTEGVDLSGPTPEALKPIGPAGPMSPQLENVASSELKDSLDDSVPSETILLQCSKRLIERAGLSGV